MRIALAEVLAQNKDGTVKDRPKEVEAQHDKTQDSGDSVLTLIFSRESMEHQNLCLDCSRDTLENTNHFFTSTVINCLCSFNG